MSNTVYFRRPLCLAAESIGFEHQLNLYMLRKGGERQMDVGMEKITTANVGLADGMLVADFYLDDTLFAQPEEIVVTSLLASGPPDAATTAGTALQLTGVVIDRRWPIDAP